MRARLFSRMWTLASLARWRFWMHRRMTIFNAITDVPGIQVGHWTDLDAATGCTVVLCPSGAVAGVDVRGGAPGTRETDLLDPACTVEQVHAVLLGGGSAFGLAAADGVMRWLEERQIGFHVGVAHVPIVPAAILFDLGVGSPTVRPTAQSGYAACEAAAGGAVAQGNVGTGAGATVGKMLGFEQATKGGLGTASIQIEGGVIVAALVAVNAVGDVVDPRTGQVIAGARKPGGGFAFDASPGGGAGPGPDMTLRNTTIAVVATNAKLSKAGATKVAQMAHDGLARVIRPAHSPMDGDTVFALSLGSLAADTGRVGAVAAEVLSEAVLAGVMAAEALKGIPSARDLQKPARKTAGS